MEVRMSQPTEKLQARDALAERIAAGLRGRQKVGAERQIQEREYQRRNSDRALARHYRLRGELVGRWGEPIASSMSKVAGPRKSLPQAISDIHLGEAAGVLLDDQPYVVRLRWNSTSGPTAR
jgi:hypothetical protein